MDGMRCSLVGMDLFTLAFAVLVAAPLPERAQKALVAELEDRARPAGGTVAIAALHVESGQSVSLRGDQGVFMASVVKLPVAVAVLARAERGELSVERPVTLGPEDMRPGRSPVAERHPKGVTLKVAELIEAAVSDSDNTASDALQRLLGGPAGTAAELRRLKVDGIDVSRTYGEWGREFPKDDEAQRRQFLSDTRDRATPDGVVQLLARLQRGELLGRDGTARLLRIMTETRNPTRRIPAGVPVGTQVAHKTGTWGDDTTTVCVNDVGLITLPDGTHLAVAVMAREPKAKLEDVEAALARVTRALYSNWAPRGRRSQ
jgi:beta-lactamase class A